MFSWRLIGVGFAILLAGALVSLALSAPAAGPPGILRQAQDGLAVGQTLMSAPPLLLSATPIVREFPVVTHTAAQLYPAISGNIVVWDDRRTGSPDIYGKDLTTGRGFAVVTHTGSQMYPAISGDTVVWVDYRTIDIYGKNLTFGAEFPVVTNTANQEYPAISGNIVVWQDMRNTYYDIYGKDLATGREFPVVTDPAGQWKPAISGNIVVWEDYRSNINYDIYGKDLGTGREFPVVTHPAAQWNPAISGNIVVWEDERNQSGCGMRGNCDIYGKNLSTGVEFAVVTNPAQQTQPAIDGNIVVWTDWRNGNADIYGKNLATGVEFAVVTNAAHQYRSAISGNTIVWEDSRNGNWDIYGARLKAKWTVMVYLDGDNDLEGAAINDFLEMAQVGSDENIGIVVQFDRSVGYDTRYGDWTTAKRFYVSQGMTPISANAVDHLGEVNMGDRQILVNFVTWAKANYPAERYALVLWDHGNGWLPGSIEADKHGIAAIACDDTGDCLDLAELRSALQQITNNGAFPLQLLSMDACLMAMAEVDHQVRPYALVRTASEETEPGTGYPYEAILRGLQAHPTWTQEELGSWIVQKYYEFTTHGFTQSAVRLGAYGPLVAAVDNLARVLFGGLPRYRDQIKTARLETQKFEFHANVDLRHFAERLNAVVTDTAIRTAATAVISATNGVFIVERHGANWPGARGLSIYFPKERIEWIHAYTIPGRGPLFAQQTAWDEFLMAYLGPPVVYDLEADPLVAITGTTFRYQVVSITGTVQAVVVFDPQLQEARRIIPGLRPPGSQAVFWDLKSNAGSYVPNGVYIAIALARDLMEQWSELVVTPVVVQRGAGPSPISEAEARALAEKWLKENQGELRQRLEKQFKAP